MTREEAIYQIKQLAVLSTDKEIPKITEALDMAIEALSQPIVAKHFDIQSGYIYCSPQIAENVKIVVRCKDCRWWQDNNDGYPHANCHWCETETPDEDDFCSLGERREP